MKKITAIFTLFALVACAAGDFFKYDGGEILTGKGGFKYEKNGIDVYENSAPNRKFTIIGFVKNNLIVPEKTKIGNLANSAKAAGGDAIIVMDQGRELKEFIAKDQFNEDEFSDPKDVAGGAFSPSYINSADMFKTRAVVIKYAY